MRIFYFILFLVFNSSVSGQNEAIVLGILPSQYGEGMPIEEFKEFENNVIKYLKAVDRFEIINQSEDSLDVDWNGSWSSQAMRIKAASKNIKAPYFLQMVFGDTEWTANTTASVNWSNNATLWITFNLYDVATGTLENTITANASSNDHLPYRAAAFKEKMNLKRAVSAGQKSLWKKVKKKIYRLFPVNTYIQKVEREGAKGVELVSTNAGAFDGLTIGDELYVYYEKEYIVRGKPTMRHISAGKLKVTELNVNSSICEVKKGNDDISELLKEGKKLKCKIIDYFDSSANYGF